MIEEEEHNYFHERRSSNLNNLTFKDVVAVNALIRPGVDVNLYIQNRNNPDNIVYHDDRVKNILSHTYGVILFQEQVMKLCVELAVVALSAIKCTTPDAIALSISLLVFSTFSAWLGLLLPLTEIIIVSPLLKKVLVPLKAPAY